MRLDIIRCNTCKKEQNAKVPLPDEWIICRCLLYCTDMDDLMHFCCKHCMATWATADDMDAEIANAWRLQDGK